MDDHNEHACAFCKKSAPAHLNFCSRQCQIDLAKSHGAVEHLPNGLPIRSISYGGSEKPLLVECAGGDHPSYICPVTVERIGPIDDGDRVDYEACTGRSSDGADDDVLSFQRELHALIYTDGTVAVTLYECCYAMWNIHTARSMGHLWHKNPYENTWQLSAESIEQIRAHVARREASKDEKKAGE